MKKRSLKNKLISILAAATMLIGTVPAMAADSYTISITDPFDYNYIQQTSPKGQNEGYLAMQSSQNNIDSGSFVEYNVYIEEAGIYDFEIKSTFIEEDRANYTSPTAVTVNGVSINSSLNFKSKTDDITGIYKGTVNLEAGENIIRFTITSAKKKGDGIPGLFYLHYVNITPNITTVVDGGKLIVEAQNYSEGSHTLKEMSASACYGGSFFYPGVITSGTVFYQYNLEAPETGEYSMELFASNRVNWLGRYEVLINGTKVGDTSVGGVFENQKTTVSGGDGTWFIRSFNPVAVNLNKGKNTILIRSYEGGTNNNRGFALDCFKFTLKEKGVMKFDTLGNPKDSGSQYYEGYVNQKTVNNGEDVYTLNLPAGTYDMYVAAGSSVWTPYFGTLAFKIGDGEYTDFNTNNVTKIRAIGDAGTFGIFKYNTPITLTGEETIAFVCSAVAEKGSNNNIIYDFFEFVPQEVEVVGAEINVASNKLSCGDTMQADSKLYYENAYECGDFVVESVSYASSNTNVATVDENGVITAVNPGFAEISVTYNDTYTAKTGVSVYDESGIIPISSSYNAETGKATVKVARIDDATGKAAVIFGAYDEENGNKTSFTDVQLETEINPAIGRVKTATKTIMGNNICAFIWDSLAGLKPLADVIELK